MRMRTVRRMKKQMKAFVKEQYDEELRGMCAYKFWRRVGIAIRIVLGKAE
jgi:hypothetical protein